MPRTKKIETNGHAPTTDPSSPMKGEAIESQLNSDAENLENQINPNADAEAEIAVIIATRYYGCIAEIAPAIASEFWNRLDRSVAAEIIKQRPGGGNSQSPQFLDGLEGDIAQVDVTTRAIASGGGAI